MSDIYRRYSTLTGVSTVRHMEEVNRTAARLAKVLLPILRRHGIRLSDASVLEFGAGWGRNLLALQRLGCRKFWGVDVSEEQVSVARSLGLTSVAAIRTGEDILSRFSGCKFDLILAFDVLEHMSLNEILQFSELVPQLLRRGGLLGIQVPNDLAPLNPIRAGDVTHLRAFTCQSVEQLFRLSGLQLVAVRGVAFSGSGIVYRTRLIVTRYLLRPVLLCLSRVAYGRADRYGVFEPNILAVGKLAGGE